MYRVVLLLHVPQKLLIAKVLKPAELTKYVALKIYKRVERTPFIFFIKLESTKLVCMCVVRLYEMPYSVVR